jgi:PKD repeat protein
MKKIFLAFIFSILFCIHFSFGQAGEWVWLSGDSTANTGGVYGTQGIPSVNNHPPGGYEYIDWKDKQGNFWVYDGWAGYHDLWKYNPVTNEWTWVKGNGIAGQAPVYGIQGVPSLTNSPGSRLSGIPTWVDTTGNLWLCGGSFLNDLWRYNISTNEWTWMKGDTVNNAIGVHGTMGIPSSMNVPGGRVETTSAWTDSLNNLWFFGGNGFDDAGGSGLLNDLMKYDISTNEWTWMSGSALSNAPSNYGIKGVSSPLNVPGGRWSHAKWKDLQGNFWILGSYNGVSMNDLWKFDVGINEWTWMSGSNLTNDPGVYLTNCVFDSVNIPRSRFEHRSSVTDNCGRFWLFGGAIFNPGGFLNDLWVFDPVTVKWNWVSGTNVVDQMGNYGTKGVSSPTNMPSSRIGADAWWGNDNRFYMFGGSRSPWSSYVGDLWVFTPDSTCSGYCSPQIPVALFTAPNHICPGTCTDFINLSTGASSYIWSFPGGNPSVSSDANPSGICYNSPGNYNVTLIASNGITSDTLTMNNYITVYPSPPPQGIFQSGDTLFANQGGTSYQWYFNGNIISGATDYFYVATQSGDYNVVATDENNCEVEAVINNVLAGLTTALYKGEGIVLFPNPVHDEFTIQNVQFTMGAAIQISFYDMLGELVVRQTDFNTASSVDVTTFDKGMYWLEISAGEKIYRTKFVKQ